MLSRHQTSGPNLLAFPAQSNFSGVRHPLSLIPRAQSLGYRVLLDAAAYLPTASLDLATVHPDFVVLSIYKIAGYPTGIGALVARRSALESLRRPWFAGGTVDWVSVGERRHQLRAGSEGFEDGTPPFLAAGAVAPALAAVAAGDRIRLPRYLTALTAKLLDQLGRLTHSNGCPVIAIHGPTDIRDRGATVAVTVCAPDGSTIPYWEVEAAARREGLAVRGGCFCNPGCAERAFDLEARATQPCFEALGKTFSIPRFAACLGTGAVGAIRLSLGLGSIGDDVDRAVHFFRKYVDVSALSPVAMTC
jgi:selenocysteine lyase/cysteine desulfurase